MMEERTQEGWCKKLLGRVDAGLWKEQEIVRKGEKRRRGRRKESERKTRLEWRLSLEGEYEESPPSTSNDERSCDVRVRGRRRRR